MIKTIYLNLEDDVAKVAAKLKREKGSEAVLVFPKKSFIFSDSINLRLLKKQIDLLGKKVSILTMDERGQTYAKEAGFELKHMPKTTRTQSISDIRPRTGRVPKSIAPATILAEEIEDDQDEVRPVSQASPVRPSRAPKTISAKQPVARTPVKPLSNKSSSAKKQLYSTAPVITTPVRSSNNVFLPPDANLTRPPRRRSMKAYVIGFVAVVLVIVLLLILVVLPSADITVFAKEQSVARDIDILADAKAQSPDSTKLTIPAVAVNESQTLQDNFAVQGKKEVGSKAEGRVAIYNLTGSPLNLKSGTTTLTVGSKSYTFKTDVSGIHALPNSNSDTNATVADIVANDGGEGFNLPAGTRLEITNEAFGSQPQRLYAKTVTQVVGGTSRFISVISKDDITAAQNALTKRVIDSINANLAAKNVKLVDGAYTINPTSFITEKPEQTEAQNFAAKLEVNITGLAFDENGLKNMIRQRLVSSLGIGKNLQDASQDAIVYRIKNLDVQNGLMQLSLHYESNSKPNLQVDDLKNKIAGKTKQEASDLILLNPDVDHVEVTVQPAWQSGLPRFTSKIHLQVQE
jgi:hypothetical protein